jgi:glycosyltransferase involved in cell wall biosynthesis
VVSPYLPFPLSHGGAVRIYNLCRELASEVDFHLVCFREANDTVRYDELHRIFRAVHVVDIDEKTVDASVPKQVAGYRCSAMAGLIGRLPGDLVQLEYTQMALYREQAAPRPTILVEHDITWTLYRQLGDAQAALWQSFETAALQQADAVWTMSETDQQLASAAGARQTWLVPNGVDLQRFQSEPCVNSTLTVLFVGSFRHLPNLLAFEALRVRIMPEVWKAFPDAKVHAIAGPQHERAASLAKKRGLLMPDSRIRIDGFVEDVRPAYRDCTVVAVPVPVSAGTNIKVVEAMAAGRPVVSNAVGCQGLGLADGEDLLIREIGPEFAEGIIALLGDEPLRERIAAAARKTAERRFGWDAIASEGLACYRGLTDGSGPPKLVDLT